MTNVNGQSATSSSDTLVVNAAKTKNGIKINWYPTQPKVWTEQLDKGYTVSRTEVDEDGNKLGPSVSIGGGTVLPRDSSWMATNKRIADGLLEPIMALMYDSTFIFPQNEFLNDTIMKYNYIVYETTNEFDIAEAVGLGVMDSTAQEEKNYRYTIEGIDVSATLGGDVVINSSSRNAQNPTTSPAKFTFPENLALSDMLAASRPKEAKQLHAIGKAYGDSIVIRWGPSSPRLWQQAMADGYNIYRMSPDQSRELIKTVYPWSESEITESIAHDSIALMAAGILYNDEEVNAEQEQGLFDKSSAFENNYGFALYAAERSGLAADILGLRYVDKDVSADSNYTYLIGTDGVNTPLLWGKVDLTNTLILDPKPVYFRTESQEKVIKLVWDKPENENRFSGYLVERSTDGTNFEPLNKTPLVFSENDQFPLQQFSYLDSVGVNYKEFHYRLIGLNSFSEVSEAATTIGMARDFTPPFVPKITKALFVDSLKEFTIKWQNPVQPDDFSHYQVMMSDMPNGFYSSVSEAISAEETEFVLKVGDMDIDRGFYFKIQSQDTIGNSNISMNKNCNVPDLIPPDAPEVLTGIIDSTGLVKVAWEASKAKDLAGYWLYWGNDPNQEMSLVNDDILTINSHSWYVDDVSLNEKIYFCVRPEDDVYNKGDASPIIEVSRPDKVPPTTPFVLAANPVNGEIEITWKLSKSDDVEGQLLYRRLVSKLDTMWTLLDTLSVSQNNYTDANILIDQPYQYCFKNFDDANNVSDFSNVKTAKIPFPKEKAIVSDLEVKLKKEESIKANTLNWEYQPPNDQIANVHHTFEVYRGVGGENPKFLQSVDSDINTFVDPEVIDGVLYNYAITIKYENGWKGNQSEIKSLLVR